jgi:hypothetical protein
MCESTHTQSAVFSRVLSAQKFENVIEWCWPNETTFAWCTPLRLNTRSDDPTANDSDRLFDAVAVGHGCAQGPRVMTRIWSS